ncbi:MAG: type III-B CRISPR module RAMP protein Cmr1 [Acidobacteria bacterium]|nr:type III-B CRISPR module RAMP protein Cmr1 [Acidobacteriota bacterium]
MTIKTVTAKLVMPVMIGGANARECDDPPTLRPPAVRGMLRFWTRSLGGDHPNSLESRLWGSTDTGQGISVLSSISLPSPEQRKLFPSKPADRQASTLMCHPDGKQLTIGFRIPEESLVEPLQAVVWTWLHLGAIGRRSRRGYGSLHWCSTRNPDDLFKGSGFEEFDEQKHLANCSALREYLKTGFKGMNKKVVDGLHPPDMTRARQCSSWFRFSTLDQVFVGGMKTEQLTNRRFGLEDLIHGKDWQARAVKAAERNQMGGHGQERLASPMMWRLFRTQTGSYIPVMTWSPREKIVALPGDSEMYMYLHDDLGFDKSLAGTTGLGV